MILELFPPDITALLLEPPTVTKAAAKDAIPTPSVELVLMSAFVFMQKKMLLLREVEQRLRVELAMLLHFLVLIALSH